jgi:hypothetical protein
MSYPSRPAAKVRFVCPENGTRVGCPICGCPMPHQREELAWANAKPGCDTHRAYLVRA